jgi:glycosyltransferase involved in cell wall biosynthesis
VFLRGLNKPSCDFVDNLKIAFFCPNKPLSHAHPSGDLTISRDLHNALNHMGHECREIVAFRTRWFWKSPEGWRQTLVHFLEAYRNVRRFKPDLWLTYHSYYKSPDILGPYMSSLNKIPYVIFQPMYSTRRRKASATRTGFTLNRLALKAASHTVTNNLNDIDALGRILRPHQITYLPSGIVPGDFRRNDAAGRKIRREYAISDATPVIMTAARFRPGVKCDSLVYLFHSLELLTASRMEFMLLVVGDGPMEKQLQTLAEKLLPGRTLFTGKVARRDMAQYYSAADLFAFPGIGESLGMVYLEAQACGLPVVALDSPGVSQVVIGGKTGLLVPRDGGEAMAGAIATLLKSPGAREKLGREGLLYVREQRDAQRNYRQLSQKLEEIVARFAIDHPSDL